MLTDQNVTTTTLNLSPGEALELIRQLARSVSDACSTKRTASFVLPTSVTAKGERIAYPGVVNFVVDGEGS